VLVLALFFLVIVGTIVGGITAWTANDLSNSLVFQSARNAQFALNSATQLAIQNIRYDPMMENTLNADPPSYCWGTSAAAPSVLPQSGDQQEVAVFCSTQWNPTSAQTRVVTVSACLVPVGGTPPTASACAATPGLRTVVTFDDYQSNVPAGDNVCSPAYCGSGMTINSSSSDGTAPTVGSVSPSSGPATGNFTITVNGSGFVSGSTSVQLVATTAADTNLILQIPSTCTPPSTSCVSVTSPQQLTFPAPPATTVTSYYVIVQVGTVPNDEGVSTPSGVSSAGLDSTFTYSPVAPQITSISPNSGSGSGGSSVSIDGSGFLSNAYGDNTIIYFTDTADASTVETVANWSVNSTGTVLTATTPAITTGTTYYVTVETTPPGATTAQSSSLVYTYQPYYPVADSITPTSGGGNNTSTTVTVTGLGFLSNATTVTLIPASGNGNSITLSSVSVASPSELTAMVPAGASAGSYYVSVTATWNGTAYTSCNSNGSNDLPSCSGEGAPTFTYN
jgi:IPT/TIG domain